MKKRILSLVLCAAMLLSMCLFLGAGVTEATSDTAADTTESASAPRAVNFTNVAPFVQANAQAANGPARAPLRASANAAATQAADNGVVTSKTATANADGTYTITLTSYTTGTVEQLTTPKPTDIVLVLDQSGSMKDKMGSEPVTVYTKVESWNITNYRNRANRYVKLSNGAYAPVTITESKSGDWWDTTYTYTYTYTYTDENNKQQSMTSEGQYTTFNEWQLYSKETRVLTRLEALQNAVTNFVDQVSKEATENKVDHRIAIVGFASTNEQNYKNTELLSTSKVVNYGAAKGKDYEEALVSVNGTNGSINSRLTTAIDRLDADGDTYSEYGIDMANKIFAQHGTASEAGRQRVVVMFTDGYTAPYNSNSFKYSMADAAIKNAQTSKSTYKATVYTVGVFANADPSADITENFKPSDGWSNKDNKNNLNAVQQLTAANRYMHYVSSNYPDATSLNSGGSLSDKAKPFTGGDSYYLSAGDADTLNNIFKKISNNISTPSINLGSKAEVRDIVSPYFTAPANADGVTVYAEKATPNGSGGYTWEIDAAYNDSHQMNVEVNGQEVTVTGFDYDANFVSQKGRNEKDPTSIEDCNFYGRRLVISFKVEPKAGFLGGNNVYTNDNAAIYESSTAQTPVVTFKERPQVNVRIKPVTVTAQEKNVYLLGNLTANQLRSGATVKVGDVSLDLSQENYGLAAWQTDYVDIEVTITDKAGKDVSTDGLSSLKDDTTYTVTVKVSPKETATDTTTSGAEATVQTGRSNEANVNVYKPELTFKDSEGYYGDTAPDFDSNLTNTVWKHGETEANTAVMGKAPELTLAFTPDSDAIMNGKINTRTDFGVDVTVKIDNAEVTEETVFHHEDCAGKTCEPPAGKEFLVHVNTCSLTITKNVKGEGANPNQTFVFNVKDKDGKLVTTVVLKDGKQKTITGLAVGDYTVVEDTNWSWSYKATENSEKVDVQLSGTKPNGEAKITNTAKENHWLTSIVDVINKWTAKDGKTTINNSGCVPGNN